MTIKFTKEALEDLQAVVDTVWAGAEAQNWRQSRDDRGMCVYRAANGDKCHAGYLLPDDVARTK